MSNIIPLRLAEVFAMLDTRHELQPKAYDAAVAYADHVFAAAELSTTGSEAKQLMWSELALAEYRRLTLTAELGAPRHDYEPGDERRAMDTDPRCSICGAPKH
jgi:hypothetical protein